MSKITDDEERAELRELDAAVAVEVMGWHWVQASCPDDSPGAPRLTFQAALMAPEVLAGYRSRGWEAKPCAPAALTGAILRRVPHYSTDIAAAWKMEGELAGLGAAGEYVRRLTEMTFPVTFAETSGLSSGARAGFYQNTPVETFLLLGAPLERRCRAALAAVRGRR